MDCYYLGGQQAQFQSSTRKYSEGAVVREVPENIYTEIDVYKSELSKAVILGMWSMDRNVSITWELVTNADSQDPSKILNQNLSAFTNIPWRVL